MNASTVLRLASDLSPRPSDRTPIRGIFVACWVCAASGQVATAPTKRAMKARRCMSTPKFKRRHTAAKPSTLIGLILSSEAQPQCSTDVPSASFASIHGVRAESVHRLLNQPSDRELLLEVTRFADVPPHTKQRAKSYFEK